MDDLPRLLPLVLRAFTTRASRPRGQHRQARRGGRQRVRRYPHEALVFDTETTGINQRLGIGVWQLLRDPASGVRGTTCIEEGLFYADDLPQRDPEAFEHLQRFAEGYPAATSPGYPSHVALMSQSEWLEQRLYRFGYRHRNRCDVVGFNLGFDLGAVAKYASAGRGQFRGGWSLGLWGEYDAEEHWHDARFHPRLLLKPLDGRRTRFSWGSLRLSDQDDLGSGGRFVDLAVASLALTVDKHSLESACRAFGEPYEKADVEYGTFDEDMFRYALDDTRRTARLYRSVAAEAARYEGIDLQLHRLYSSASVAVATFEAIRLARPLDRFTDLERWELGWPDVAVAPEANPTPVERGILSAAMSAFFGGRAEGRFVREPLPVVVVDAVSMYPTCDALLGTWPMLIAERLETADLTDQVRAMLAGPDLEAKCLTRDFWRDEIGCTLVELDQPAGAILPARSRWNPTAADPGIGVNPLTYRGRLWYMLPDVIAARLHGAELHVSRAMRLHPVGVQPGLRPVRFRGGPVIDPLADDPFVALVEERQRVRNDQSLAAEERKRRAQAAKVTVNSASYGVLARFDRHELPDPVDIRLWGPDGEPLPRRTAAPEDPGPYCWPPAAANVTAGARLMLTLMERRVAARGGTDAYVDTDSAAIVSSPEGGALESAGETHRVLAWDEVVAVIAEFDDLNPYDPEFVPHLWKVEHDSMTEPLYAYVVSAKRYVLFRREPDGRPRLTWTADESDDAGEDSLTDWSEHGLGVYLDPTATKHDRGKRDTQGRRRWMRDAWEYVLGRELAIDVPPPSWVDRYALTQFSLARPQQLAWFAGRDRQLPADERMRPYGFGLIAQPHGFLVGLSGRRRPAAPYEREAALWEGLDWYDRTTGEALQLTGIDPAADPDRLVAAYERGAVRVKTLGDVLTSYARRAEYKSLPPDGRLPHGRARGLLRRRPIESTPALTTLAGKEGNRLLERASGELAGERPRAYRLELGSRADWWDELLLPVARSLGAVLVAQAMKVHRRTVERALARAVRPTDARLHRWAVALARLARQELSLHGVPEPRDDLASLQAYLDALPYEPRRCECGCGAPLAGHQRRWATEACRKRAWRRTIDP